MRWVKGAAQRWRVLTAGEWRFLPAGEFAQEEVRSHLVIARQPMASIDYYLGRELMGEHSRVAFDSEVDEWLRSAESFPLPGSTRVVLVRMPDSRWASVLERLAGVIAEVVWLIDDDVLAAREDQTLPAEYRRRLLSDYLSFRKAFQSRVAKVWASTPVIAARYPEDRVELRRPSRLDPPEAHEWITVFYHGTASHRGEHAFLKGVFAKLQEASVRTVIEVCGDHELRRLYRGIPRLRVLHPISWPDYLPLLHAGRYDIGLVPLLDTPFNRGRSGIKALEIAGIGAEGVVSSRPPYTDYADLPGIHLVSDDPDEWVTRILTLVEQRRTKGAH